MKHTRYWLRAVRTVVVGALLVVTACGGGDAAEQTPSSSTVGSGSSATNPTPAEPSENEPDTSEPDTVSDGSVPGDAEPRPTGNEADGLAMASLRTTQATSFDRVPVDGVADAVAREAVVYLVGFDVLPRPVFVDDDGPFLIAPLHPAQLDGGTLELRIERHGEVGPTFDLTVDPPPSAPGATAAAHGALLAAVEQRAASLGTSSDALRAASLADLDPIARHLSVALSWLDLATAQLDELSDADRDIVDGIAGAANWSAVFAGEAIDLPTDLSFELRPLGANGFRTTSPQSGAACIHYRVEINTVEELSEAMLQATAAGRLSAREGSRGRLLEATSSVLSVAGFDQGLRGSVATLMSLELAAFDAVMNGISGLNPSRLTALRAQLDRTVFDEDSTKIGAWTDVKVQATSTGWIADADAANVLLNLASVFAPGAQAGGTVDDVIENLGDEFIVAGGELVNQTLNTELQQIESNIIHFCPENWLVPVNSPGYVEGRALANKLSIDNAAFTYRPQLVGDDLLRLDTLPERFAGRYVKLDTPVETRPIEVVVTPGLIIVEEAGEPVNVGATIENAETPTLKWDPGAGSWDDGIGADTNGPQSRTLKTPTSESAYPFQIRVTSTTSTGLRDTRTPERFGTATVTLKPFDLIATPDELRPGEVSLVTAVDNDGNAVEVTWEWSGGQLESGQTGRAGFSADEPGEYVVTATNAAGISQSVTIFVVGGDCSFAYTIGGTRFIGQDGDVVLWSSRSDSESRLLMGNAGSDEYSTQLTFTTDGGMGRAGGPVVAVGSYDIRFADFTIAGDVSLGASVFDSGSVDITAFDEGVTVAGSGAGSVLDPDGGYSVDRIPFSFEFSVYDAGVLDREDTYLCNIEQPDGSG